MADKDKNKLAQQSKNMPKDGQVIISIMKEMGITEYEPKTVIQLTDFVYRYTTSVLEDARGFANNSKKNAIDLEDVRLALQLNNESTFTVPPPREAILDLVQNKNLTPLPLIKPHCGLRLPPDRHCLSTTNYTLKIPSNRNKNKGANASGAPNLSGIKVVSKPTVNYIRRTSTVPVQKQTVSMAKHITNIVGQNQQHKTIVKPKIQIQQQSSIHVAPGSPMDVEISNLKRKREDEDAS